MDTNIEDSADLDFIFTNKTLEAQFTTSGDNVKMTYDRATHSMKGQFDIAGTTYTCKSFIVPEATDTFADNVCSASSGDITSCTGEGVEYAMSYTCDNTAYSYILKKCIITSPFLSVTKASNGSGIITSVPAGINCGSDCSEAYNTSTSISLTATPTPGSLFTGWMGACTGVGVCHVQVDSSKVATALFTLIPTTTTYTLTASKTGTGK